MDAVSLSRLGTWIDVYLKETDEHKKTEKVDELILAGISAESFVILSEIFGKYDPKLIKVLTEDVYVVGDLSGLTLHWVWEEPEVWALVCRFKKYLKIKGIRPI